MTQWVADASFCSQFSFSGTSGSFVIPNFWHSTFSIVITNAQEKKVWFCFHRGKKFIISLFLHPVGIQRVGIIKVLQVCMQFCCSIPLIAPFTPNCEACLRLRIQNIDNLHSERFASFKDCPPNHEKNASLIQEEFPSTFSFYYQEMPSLIQYTQIFLAKTN